MKIRKQLVIAVLLVFSCFRVEGAEQSLLMDVLQKAFPDYQVSMTSGKTAALQRGETTMPIELEAITEFTHADTRFLAVVVVFNELQEGLSVRFRKGEDVALPSHKNRLLLVPVADPSTVRSVVIDNHVLGSARHEIMIQDMIGDGTSQLVLAAESVYPLYQPRETSIAQRSRWWQGRRPGLAEAQGGECTQDERHERRASKLSRHRIPRHASAHSRLGGHRSSRVLERICGPTS